ncbi:MAG TPA: hypothetical protein VGD69_00295 [Herpetosiphonaceae bacterium]
MQQPEQDDVPANMQISGLRAYRDSIAGMLRRLAAERLIERLWSRDPSLWYPAAETQDRIRARLGWLDLPVDSDAGAGWLARLRSRGIENLLYVGSGDASSSARMWQDLAAPHTPRLMVLDTIEPLAVQSILASINWEHTALLLAADSMLTPDLDALARIVLAARAPAAPANPSPLAVVAPHDSPLLPLARSYAEPELLPLPPDLGARFGPLSPLGLLPAAWLGWQIDRLRAAALEMRAQCRRDDLSLNPGVWLGTTLAVLAQSGRDKLTLLASPELLPLARWLAAFISGSLSKHGRGFVMDVEEPRTTEPRTGAPWANLEPNGEPRTTEPRTTEHNENQEPRIKNQEPNDYRTKNNDLIFPPRLPQPRLKPAEVWGRGAGCEGLTQDWDEGQPHPHDRIVVALRLSNADNADLDQECAALEIAGLPIIMLELEDRYAVAAQIVAWQLAVATIGVVIGLNPFDEPDTAARDAYLWRRLEAGDARALPPATPLEPAPLAEAWRQLSPALTSPRCIAIAAYLPGSAAVGEQLAALRSLLARRFGVIAIVIDPLREQAFATQVLHAGRPCALLLLTADAAAVAAVPGRDWTLDDLRRERIAADLLAWTQLERRFVHLDLGSDPAHGLRCCLDLLATLDP